MKKTEFFKVTILLLSILACQREADEYFIMTVTGPVSPAEMGTTLIHEHVMVDWIGADSTGYHRWDKTEVTERALPFITEARDSGMNTFIDCTPAFLGRDPYVLKELSEKTGVHIITNTGYYGAIDNKYIPNHAYTESAEEIAQRWIREYENGIDGGEIRPGFIKIAVERDDTLSSLHEKIISAAAIAHLETGLTIVSHTGPDGPAFAQINILREKGVSPEAFVWTHAQNGTFDKWLEAAEAGAWISLDDVRGPAPGENGNAGNIDWYVNQLLKLRDAGIIHKVLISHDSGWYNVGQPDGGDYNGYTAIFDLLLPELKRNGFTGNETDQLLVENPQNAFKIKIRNL